MKGLLSEQLIATLRARTGVPDLELDAEPQPLTGGFYAQMLRFRLANAPEGLDGELVARIVPDEQVGIWESTIQAHVADRGVPTPRVRLTADGSSPLGRHLMVMDHVDGHPPLSGLGFATIARSLPSLARQLPDELADMAARLHALDPEPLARCLRALRLGMPLTAAEYVERQTLQAKLCDAAELVRAGERLLRTQPPAGPDDTDVVAHGDLHPFNVLETQNGTVLVDWTVALVAHPAFTLAFTELLLSNPPIQLPKAGAVALRWLGRRMARRFLDSYESHTAQRAGPVDAATLAWHRQVHALRILVELAGWDAAGHRPRGHPWLVLEPVARRELSLD